MAEEAVEKVKEKEESVNLAEEEDKKKERLVSLLTNELSSNPSSLPKKVKEIEETVNLYKGFCTALSNENKATLIYLLRKNKVSYFGEAKRLLASNGGNIAFLLGQGDGTKGWLEEKGIVRRLKDGEFPQEREILEQDRKGGRHIERFFCLTDKAEAFYSKVPEEELQRLTKKADLVNRKHKRFKKIKSQYPGGVKVNKKGEIKTFEEIQRERLNKELQQWLDAKQKEFSQRKKKKSLKYFRRELAELKQTEEYRGFSGVVDQPLQRFSKWDEAKWQKYMAQRRERANPKPKNKPKKAKPIKK